jgi:ADP-ribosylglycohydrolase
MIDLTTSEYPIIKAAIADAYGVCFEYADPTYDRPNNLSGYYPHPRHAIGDGRYSDDTEMSTAVIEAMLEVGTGDLTRELLARWFVKAFHREQRKGYAGRFHEFMTRTLTGEDFLRNIDPRSNKSGAAMRGWPIGLYKDFRTVLEMAELQAKLTHYTWDGIKAAQAVALMTHYFAYNLGKRESVAAYLNLYLDGPWLTPHPKPVGPEGMDSVHAAVRAVVAHDSLSAILKQCIDFKGDVDTVAIIAIGAASYCRDIKQDLPQVLYDGLEDGEWGKPYLLDLDKRFAAWCKEQQTLPDF